MNVPSNYIVVLTAKGFVIDKPLLGSSINSANWRRKFAITVAIIMAISVTCSPTHASFPQTVFLDYDAFTDTIDDSADHVYTASERTAILDTLNDKFADYPVTFTNTAPVSGLFSTLFYNVGLSRGAIDFQNKKMSDTAEVHAPKLLDIAGIPLGTATSSEVVQASINIGAHETLHILGTRHHDAFLPVGSGVTPGTGGGDWTPEYTGPEDAFLTSKEFNSLTMSLGNFSEATILDPDLFVGPRSAVKLLHDTFVDLDVDSDDENVIFDPQPLPLKTIPLPNPLPPGDPFASFDLFADMVIVEEASIEMFFSEGTPVGPESDYYLIDATEGDIFTVEVISSLGPDTTFDTSVAVLDPAAGYTPVPWWPDAVNDNERESTDSLIQDVIIPADGPYVIEVYTPYGSLEEFGDYEMLVYRLYATPGPTLLGDYNNDGTVDAADYTVWQDNLGLDSSVLGGNGSGAATVVQTDYELWKTQFGESIASASTAGSVPEPTTLLLALLPLVAVPLRVRHR